MPRPERRPEWRAGLSDVDASVYTEDQMADMIAMLKEVVGGQIDEGALADEIVSAARTYRLRLHQSAGPTDGEVKVTLEKVAAKAAELSVLVRELDDRSITAIMKCDEDLREVARKPDQRLGRVRFLRQFDGVGKLAEASRTALTKLEADEPLPEHAEMTTYLSRFISDPFTPAHDAEPFHQWILILASIYQRHTGQEPKVARRLDAGDEPRTPFMQFVNDCLFTEQDLGREALDETVERVLGRAMIPEEAYPDS